MQELQSPIEFINKNPTFVGGNNISYDSFGIEKPSTSGIQKN
uniref:Uncharacterized protein n=1 Tax=Lepeophtheirus salmonis TaxID=72036 RepID=A0A0K2U2T6_LEPSM